VIEPSSEVARLWLQTLNRIGVLTSHELRGAINSVSVSLEVVRSRCLRPGTPLADVAPFAEGASDQLGVVTSIADALLYLVRPAPDREDVGATVRRLTVLLDAAAKGRGGALELERTDDDGDTRTSAGSEVSRLILAAVLLAAIETEASASCRVTVDSRVVVRVKSQGGAMSRIDEAVAAAATGAGIELRHEPSEVILAFPRSGNADRSI
jgi:hypothetical protein